MRAVINKAFGGPEVLSLSSVPDISPSAEEILVEVRATALNRADTLQRKGKYPPPQGASPILGLEIAGTVIATGSQAKEWQPGDRVFGLIPGGGYAEQAIIHKAMAMKIPTGMNMVEAAAIPEVFLTAFQSLFWLANLQEGEKVLVHAGASGVGTAAIQLAKTKKAQVFVTASAPKHKTCLRLGANGAFDYTTGPFAPWVLERTEGKGVNIILDFIGGDYFSQNIDCLQKDGRMVQLATMGGAAPVAVDLRKLLSKRLHLMGSTLRSRSLAYQIKLTEDFKNYALEKFQKKTLQPIIGKVFDLKDVQDAHRFMESNKNEGKIVLEVKREG